MPTRLDDEDAIAKAFWRFHQENPEVFDELVRLAKQLLRVGRNRYGIKALFEIVRFHRAMQTTDPCFKLNNNYHALYARLIMNTVPELGGFFELRERLSRKRYDRKQEEYESWFR